MPKILVIEDEKSVRENIVDLLEAEDFQTASADNGRTGIDLAKVQSPDLILCDVTMPIENGFAVLSELRQDPATAAIPFIFLTARAAKADFREGMELGADDYLTKPFSRSELLRAITSRLEKQERMRKQFSMALRQAEEKLKSLVNRDVLTGLPNRMSLGDQFNQVLQQRDDERPPVPLLFFNLNRFSRINELMGPASGDSLLKGVATRLFDTMNGRGVVVRLDADRFVIIPTGSCNRDKTKNLAREILETLSRPFIIFDQEIFVTASMGAAFYPEDGDDLTEVVQNAEIAMSSARQLGGNQYRFYTRALQVKSSDLLVLEARLHRALEKEEFKIYYQPQVSFRTGQIVGAEALLRWWHRERGLISPSEFIPLTEDNGLILPVGEWVLKETCKQMRLWLDAGIPPIKMSVNLSARQFNQADLREQIELILKEADIEPNWLELELTESILARDAPTATAILRQLRDLGVRIAIDDFGTGYSSFSYLKQFPFDTLKIDRSFVANLTSDPNNAAITTAVIQLARDLQLNVVAEGVETEAELSFLRQQHCHAMQGYLFSPAVPAKEFERMLMTRKGMQFRS